jgi:hypothetical protein
MVDTGYIVPTGNLIVKGRPSNIVYKNCGTVANAYPGRLVVKEDTEYDVKVSDGVLPPLGYIGYEQQAIQYQVASKETINVVDTELAVLSGGGFTIYMPSGLARGFKTDDGTPLLSWANGQVVAGANLGGKLALKIPFSKANPGAADTNIDLPAGIVVTGAAIEVTTAASGGTIDVGIDANETGGDADGFLDGVSCAATGFVINTVDATDDATNQLGVLISDTLKSGDTTAIYYRAPVGYKTDGTAKSITYTTSNHTIAGNIYLFVESPGIIQVGTSGTVVDSTAAAAGVFVNSIL